MCVVWIATVLSSTDRTGATRCSSTTADQGAAGATGWRVWKASGGTIENLTVCNFRHRVARRWQPDLVERRRRVGHEIGLHTYNGSYLSATSTYTGADGDAPLVRHLREQQRRPRARSRTPTRATCRTPATTSVRAPTATSTLDDAHAQYSALGYSGTNSGGHLIVAEQRVRPQQDRLQHEQSEQRRRAVAARRNVPEPRHRSDRYAFVLDLQHNFVHDNNNANVPGTRHRRARSARTGLVIAGGRNDTVIDNRFENNGSWAVLIVPFPDTDTPPPDRPLPGRRSTASRARRVLLRLLGQRRRAQHLQEQRRLRQPDERRPRRDLRPARPGNCWHENTDPDGVTSAPADVQVTNGVCGIANAGEASRAATLTTVICTTELLARCPQRRATTHAERRS